VHRQQPASRFDQQLFKRAGTHAKAEVGGVIEELEHG
jgi:hypothetical protein